MASTSVSSSPPVPPECKRDLKSFRAARQRWKESPRKKLTPLASFECKEQAPDDGDGNKRASSKLEAVRTDVGGMTTTPTHKPRSPFVLTPKQNQTRASVKGTGSSIQSSDHARTPRRIVSQSSPVSAQGSVLPQTKMQTAENESKDVAEMSASTSPVSPDDAKRRVDIPESPSHRERLIAFYLEHNPSKVGSVDSTLETYNGREEVLFRKLEEKYVKGFPPAAGEGTTCFLEFDYNGRVNTGRVEVVLFENRAPLACENFRALCTGEKGKSLVYRSSRIHRIVPGFCIQGGDTTKGDGTGGKSIYPPNSEHGDTWGKFKDEYFMSHNRKGLLSMANNGPNRNGSQFFITLKPVTYLDGKHVVFGEVTNGMQVVEDIAQIPTDSKQRPRSSVVIADCGEVRDGVEMRASNDTKETKPFGGTFGTLASGGSVAAPSFAALSSEQSTTFGTTSSFSLSATASKQPVVGTSATPFGVSSTTTAPAFGGFGCASSTSSDAPHFTSTESQVPLFGRSVSSQGALFAVSSMASRPSVFESSASAQGSLVGGTQPASLETRSPSTSKSSRASMFGSFELAKVSSSNEINADFPTPATAVSSGLSPSASNDHRSFGFGALSSAVLSSEPAASLAAEVRDTEYDYSSDSDESNSTSSDGSGEDNEEDLAQLLRWDQGATSIAPAAFSFMATGSENHTIGKPSVDTLGLDALSSAICSAEPDSSLMAREASTDQDDDETAESRDEDSTYEQLSELDEDEEEAVVSEVSEDPALAGRRTFSVTKRAETTEADEPRSNPFAGVNFAQALERDHQASSLHATFSFANSSAAAASEVDELGISTGVSTKASVPNPFAMFQVTPSNPTFGGGTFKLATPPSSPTAKFTFLSTGTSSEKSNEDAKD